MKTTIIFLAALLLFACDQGPKSPRGFSLPEGDMEQGYQVFKRYQCQDCHRIAGEKAPEDAQYLVAKPIPLGGSSGRIKTYAELVTSIINPLSTDSCCTSSNFLKTDRTCFSSHLTIN